jgi:hypothetical protein
VEKGVPGLGLVMVHIYYEVARQGRRSGLFKREH